MDSAKYRALVCAIDRGSISEAALRLGYTPSAVSRMIGTLEAEHGFPLLLRSKSGVVPTAECQRLLPLIRSILAEVETLWQSSRQISGCLSGTVTIATAYSAYYDLISRVIGSFQAKYPGIAVEIADGGYSSELVERLAKQQIDLAILSQREGEISFTPLRQDELVVLLPEAHPCAALERAPLSVLEREPYIDTYPGKDTDNQRMLRRNGISPRTAYVTSDVYATCAMVKAGLGVGLLNWIGSGFAEEGVHVLPLDPPQRVWIGVAARRQPAPAAGLFREALLEAVGGEVETGAPPVTGGARRRPCPHDTSNTG